MTTYREHLAELLKNPEFREEWDRHEDCRQELNEALARTAALAAENARLRTAIQTVLADGESQHPGGWGPDITMVAVLRKALDD